MREALQISNLSEIIEFFDFLAKLSWGGYGSAHGVGSLFIAGTSEGLL